MNRTTQWSIVLCSALALAAYFYFQWPLVEATARLSKIVFYE